MKLVDYINKSIEISFYALFLFVPLVFAPNTSELFEFNKMWLTFGITALIAALWFSKMILVKKFVFRRTLLDLPIALFLISTIISTIFSMDPHMSFWGYYSRWNGGLISIFTYIFLYYAFVSNFFSPDNEDAKQNKNWYDAFMDSPTGVTVVKRSIIVSIISGLVIAFWSIPAHFGYDPTCLFFRGSLDVACWTADFQPKIRIFGPLGQPDWLAGYMSILMPFALGMAIVAMRKTKEFLNPSLIFYAVSFFLFYIALLYTGSRSGIAGGILASIILVGIYLVTNIKNLKFLKHWFVPTFLVLILFFSFFIGVRVPVLDKISFAEVQKVLTKPDPLAQSEKTNSNVASDSAEQTSIVLDETSGGSDSFHIRKIVWKGALDAWRDNPIIGTGVETFAFAYYKYRPIEHNNVSEWNFLYNKAHNEYLNYLTTTGVFGLGTYLLFLGMFMVFALINIFHIKFKPLKFLKADSNLDFKDPTIAALVASFVGIIFINFFGFSVVIMNIYLFLIPAFALVYLSMIKPHEDYKQPSEPVTYFQWSAIAGFFLGFIFIVWFLINSWSADTNYALGMNYDRANQYQTAYPYLEKAVKERQEPVFLDEFSVNQSVMAVGFAQQGGSESAALVGQLTKSSIDTNDKLIKDYPHNLLYWKSRIRILYGLSQIDERYLPLALEAAKKAEELAPTDASILYNVGVLYGQNGDNKKAIEVLEKTVNYKPNYREAHFALGLFYHDLGTKTTNKVTVITDPVFHQKAIDQMNYILTNIYSKDPQATDSLQTWEKER